MTTENDDGLILEFSLQGNGDTSPLIFISEKKRAYYRRIEKAGKDMSSYTRRFYDALNGDRADPEFLQRIETNGRAMALATQAFYKALAGEAAAADDIKAGANPSPATACSASA